MPSNSISKTLFVLPALEAGGAERVLITLMNDIDREHYDPEFLSVRGDGNLKDLIDDSIPFHGLNQKLSPFSLLSLFFKLRKIQPDIVVSTMAHMNFALLLLKPFFPKTSFVIREAITPSFLFEKHDRLGWLIKIFYKRLYPTADCVISPTARVFTEFSEDLGLEGDNFVVLKNPINVERVRQETDLPEVTEQRHKEVHFVACGRLGKQKGFDALIECLNQLDLPYAWRLDILGEGSERENLESQIKEKNLEDKVFLLGLMRAPYKHFAKADCFVLPSRFEGSPNVVLEALTCGTRVIATRSSGGIQEIQREVGDEFVRIVDTMDEFVAEMSDVTPNPKEVMAESLMPHSYDKSAVIKDFEKMLFSLSTRT